MSSRMLLGWTKKCKGRIHGVSCRGNRISFGRYALQALEPARITSKQIEAGRRAISRTVQRGGQIWTRVIADKPVTAKPAETRMGRGKGGTKYWAAVVKPGRILYEIGGTAESVAKKAIAIAASKMPIRTKFVAGSSKLPLDSVYAH
ncbi:50S ribosomal protein L16, chloroplastic [Morella rubra]|uniref:50S ribosomal protein L16, chloroplastic n=1 Tax=Morella rubra TaxID=262757 RepID=A0A6A1W4Y7_9ROSI|nr:50S ribosomal protein L16, chloroplastic [Morella rubra]